MKTTTLTAVLGRNQHEIGLAKPLAILSGCKILITGALGSIGVELGNELYTSGATGIVRTDINTVDVRKLYHVQSIVDFCKPDVIFHLAGAKHAPAGELDPLAVAETNITGTVNVIKAAEATGARVILASTCKACDPETVYGASKLIAERLVLESGGSVSRFHNVVESSGNVFEIWEKIPDNKPLYVTPCTRYFISLREAVALLLWTSIQLPGRYIVDPGISRRMLEVARAFRPDAAVVRVDARRGDRKIEPFIGSSELSTRVNEWLLQVTSPHEDSILDKVA